MQQWLNYLKKNFFLCLSNIILNLFFETIFKKTKLYVSIKPLTIKNFANELCKKNFKNLFKKYLASNTLWGK